MPTFFMLFVDVILIRFYAFKVRLYSDYLIMVLSFHDLQNITVGTCLEINMQIITKK